MTSGRPSASADGSPPATAVVRVVPDVSGIDKVFDYEVPAGMRAPMGALVRIDLNGRRVGGWVVDVDVAPPPGVSLRPIERVSSVGPSAEVIDLARWVAHRWSGRLASVLTSASPDRMVPVPTGAESARRTPAPGTAPAATGPAAELFEQPGVTVVRVPPTVDPHDIVLAAARHGDAVIVAPTVAMARHHGARLRRDGVRAWLAGRDLGPALDGGSVIGARTAVLGRVRSLAAVVVLDEHDESLQEERNPTWHARDVAVERARRAGVPCVLVSPAPSVAALEHADRVIEPSRGEERRGWPRVVVADRRDEDPVRGGLFSPELTRLVRGDRRVICVLNRTGRARMLACASCGELVRTVDGEHLMVEVDGRLRHEATGEERPLVCAVCTGTTLKRLRLGVTRAVEELTALVGEPVGDTEGDERVIVGTEAALHRNLRADAVAFLDLDQELLAPRYRSGEQAMALIVRAARLVGPGGELLLQTRSPEHRVVRAALRSDPATFASEEAALRRAGSLPPLTALAELSGAGADEFADALRGRLGVELLGPDAKGRWLVRAPDPATLADHLAATDRPKARLRVAVDPPRI